MSIKNLEIKASEAKAVEVASLPTRPTSSATYGGRGLTAQQMKEAYDKYPALIKERFNALVADLLSGSALGDIPLGDNVNLSHAPWSFNDSTLQAFVDKVVSVIDYETDDESMRTIYSFVKQFVHNVATGASLEYNKSTRQLTLTIDGEQSTVIIEVDKYEQAINGLTTAVAYLQSKKFDKAGGGIDGDVTIGGSLYIAQDLTVAGNSTVQEAGHLKIKDAVIVTNKDGEKLAVPSGLAIRKGENAEGTDETYGIMYDPVSDSVKLGLIYQDENGNYLYQAGEGQPVATRADDSEMTENGLAIWDAENRRFVSKDMTDLDLTYGDTTVTYDTTDGMSINGQARFTYNGGTTKDVTMDVSIPVVPGDGITIDKKSGSEQVEIKVDEKIENFFSFSGQKKLIGFDNNENYALYELYGPAPGCIPVYESGLPILSVVTDGEEDGSDPTNLAAVSKNYAERNFVAKQTTTTTGVSYLYGYDSEGARTFQISGGAGANTVAYRGTNGVLKVGTPVASSDATTKAYVDGLHHYTHTVSLTGSSSAIYITTAVKGYPNPITAIDESGSTPSLSDLLSYAGQTSKTMATGYITNDDANYCPVMALYVVSGQVYVEYLDMTTMNQTSQTLANIDEYTVADIVA